MPETGPKEFFPWDESYSVGVAAIDEQHRRLIALINELHAEMHTGRGQDVLRDVVNRMIAYATSHFAREERCMLDCSYAGFREHKEEHDEFCDKTVDLFERLSTGRLVLSLEVIMFLRDWLTHHIMETDKKYSACFHRIGLH